MKKRLTVKPNFTDRVKKKRGRMKKAEKEAEQLLEAAYLRGFMNGYFTGYDEGITDGIEDKGAIYGEYEVQS